MVDPLRKQKCEFCDVACTNTLPLTCPAEDGGVAGTHARLTGKVKSGNGTGVCNAWSR